MVTKGKNKNGGEKRGKGKTSGKEKALKLGKETVKELGDDDMDKVAGGLLKLGGEPLGTVSGRLVPRLRASVLETCAGISGMCSADAKTCGTC